MVVRVNRHYLEANRPLAIYTVRYADDFGHEWLAKVEVYLSENGRKVSTSEDEDSDLVPGEFFSRLSQVPKVCEMPVRPRTARLHLSENDFLVVPVPIKPATPQFSDFFRKALSIKRVLYVSTKPEFRNAFYTAVALGRLL